MFEEHALLEKMYFHELDRKEQLEKSTTLPTGVIVACIGLIGYFFTHYRFGGSTYFLSTIVEFTFSASSALSAILIFTAIYWCIRAVTGSTYEYLPGAETIRGYRRDLLDWHRQNRTRGSSRIAEEEFQEFLADALARCSQKNWQTNLIRSEELFRTKRFTVLSLVVLAFSAFSYYIDFWFDPLTVPGP